jgi:hypothetical protein
VRREAMPKKYDCCLVLSVITEGESPKLLQLKSEYKDIPTEVIYVHFDGWGQMVPLSDLDLQKLQNLKGDACVFLHGHGGKGLDELANEQRQSLNSRDVANLLSHAPRKAIDKLSIKLISCHAAAGDGENYVRSFADRLFKDLCLFEWRKVEISASSDMVAVKHHPSTKKIFIHLETEREKKIREEYKEKREAVLGDVITEFAWSHWGGNISPQLESEINHYVTLHLQPKQLMDMQQFANFMAELSQFFVTRMHEEHLTSDHLAPLFVVLMMVREKLIAMTRERQTQEFDKTMREIKQANRERANAKIFFSFCDGKEKIMDYKEKRQQRLGRSKYGD